MNQVLKLHEVLDEATCYELLRNLKWKDSVFCFECGSDDIRKNGHDKGVKHRQRYICKECDKSFTDISDTVAASNHISVQKWVLCFALKDYMSNKQMAKALDLPENVVGEMRHQLANGLIKRYLDDWDW